MMGAIKRILNGTNDIDFPKWWKLGIALSTVLVVVSIGALVVRGLNLGVEFTGGISAEVTVSDDISADDARAVLDAEGQGTARVQIIETPDRRNIRVQSADTSPEAEALIIETMAELGDVPTGQVTLTTVSASWSGDVTGQAVRALAFFLVAILIYLTIRLEFRMAVAAIVATVHDLLISIGIYALFQFEVSSGTVIAFLMILGYSIYDTVVVFDKIKQNEADATLSAKMTYTAMASRAMNQVLLRSLNTSITSLMPVLCILFIGAGIFGAVTLSQFGIALAVGLAVGTYSSIMVAAPVVAALKEREPRYQQLRERLAMSGGGRVDTVVAGAPREARTPVGDGDGDTDETGSESGTRSSGVSKATTPRPATAIPPRPRKKSKRR
ncbi:MAG: protein translocase subunit SecF [Acidimicrobiia bacterium]|nr:protein translocase subunit SecF [Acidimicrobiia bacterium]